MTVKNNQQFQPGCHSEGGRGTFCIRSQFRKLKNAITSPSGGDAVDLRGADDTVTDGRGVVHQKGSLAQGSVVGSEKPPPPYYSLEKEKGSV